MQKLLIIVCLALPLSVDAMVAYHLIETPEGKQVLLLGEIHVMDQPKLAEFFNRFTASILGSNLKESLPFIVEYENAQGDAIIESQTLLQIFKIAKLHSTSALAFDYFDPRGWVSEQSDAFSTAMSDAIVKGVPAELLLKYYTQDTKEFSSDEYDETNWAALAEKIRNNAYVKEKPLTVGKLIASLEKNLQKMTALLKKYKEQPDVFTVLEQSIKRYTGALEKIKKLFPLEDNFGYTFCKSFLACKTLEERFKLFEDYQKLFGFDTDSCFADCLFFDKIFDTLSTKPSVCVLTGRDHSEPIKKLFLAMGCTLIKEDTQIAYFYPLISSYSIKEAFISGLIKEVPGFLDKLLVKPATCWSCSKKPAKLLVCSQCKKAQYCNATCQKRHWKKHKPMCPKNSF